MIFVAVGDDDAAQFIGARGHGGKIGNDGVNAQESFLGKHHTRVDEEVAIAAAVQSRVLADFADAAVKDVAKGAPQVVDGHFALPEAPGLGVELDLDAVAAFPQQHADFDLYAEGWHFRGTRR